MLEVTSGGTKKGDDLPPILPTAMAQQLKNVIKKIISNWAEAERLMGNKVFYWNILSADAMKLIAAQAPMTTDDLQDLGVLGENIVKEYGDRLVKVISNFVVEHNLEELVETKTAANRPKKRLKIDSSSTSNNNNNNNKKTAGAAAAAGAKKDEFDCYDDKDIDFHSIMIPGEEDEYDNSNNNTTGTSTATKNNNLNSSKFFN